MARTLSDRLNEAIDKWVDFWKNGKISDTRRFDGHAQETVVAAARAYADLLAGERVELDYEAALEELRRARPEWTPYVGDPFVIRNIVDAAIGDRLLIDPPKEEGT